MKNCTKTFVLALAVTALASCGQSTLPSVESEPVESESPSSVSIESSESLQPSSEPSSEPSIESSSEPLSESSHEEESSEESSSSVPSKKHWNEDGVLKILEIGNSYGEDTYQYSPDILRALGVENFIIGKMYIGGSSIEEHYNNTLTDTKTRGSYEYRKIYDSTTPNWSLTQSTSVLYAINDEEWDFISFQQQSMRSTEAEAYARFGDLISFVEENNEYKDTRYVYNMTWAYPENNPDEKYTGHYGSNTVAMYNDIVSVAQTVVAAEPRIEKILVPGTAAENARTSFLKKTLFRDDLHLSYDKGRYIAGMTYFTELIDAELPEDFSFAPESLTSSERAACIESARNALAHKYEITPSLYPVDPIVKYDGIDHTFRLEAEDGVLDGTKVKRVGCENASGGNIACDMNDCGQGLEWIHYAPVAGEHELEIAYWTAAPNSKSAIFVNGSKAAEAVYTENTNWANGFNASKKTRVTVNLKQGYNTISLAKYGFESDNPQWGGWAMIDYVDIIGTGATYDPSTLDMSATEFTFQAEYGYFHTGGVPFNCDTMECLYAVGEINSTGHGVDLNFRLPVEGKYGLKIKYAQGGAGNVATVTFNGKVLSWDMPSYAGQAWNNGNLSDVILEADCTSETSNYVSISRASTSAGWFIIDSITLVPLA